MGCEGDAYPAAACADWSRVVGLAEEFSHSEGGGEGREDGDGDAGDEEDGELVHGRVEPEAVEDGGGEEEGVDEDEAAGDGCSEFVGGGRVWDRWKVGCGCVDDGGEGFERDFGEVFGHGGMDDSWKGLFEITDVDFRWVFGMCRIRLARRIGGIGGKKGSAMLVLRVLMHCDFFAWKT